MASIDKRSNSANCIQYIVYLTGHFKNYIIERQITI